MRTYTEIRNEIEQLRGYTQGPRDLSRMRAFIKSLLPAGIRPEQVILIAGTNGKGSTAAVLDTLLLAAGERTGLFTSPHILEPTERIRVAGRDITPEQFVSAYLAVRQNVQKNFGDERLGFFEWLTLMAAHIFFSEGTFEPVTRAIFEVGLGGISDPTNAIPHSTCVITRLGMDHVAELGPTLTDIARNKFGIVGEHSLVVHAPFTTSEIQMLADEVSTNTHSKWVETVPHDFQVVREGVAEPRFILKTKWGSSELTLAGARGAENAATALTVFSELGYDVAANIAALAKVRWPGRMQSVKNQDFPCPVYLSGDHNPQGVESLLEVLQHYPRARVHFLVASSLTKDSARMIELIKKVPNRTLHLTEFTGSRSWAEFQGDREITSITSKPKDGLNRILQIAAPGDLVVATGSLYLLGEVQKILN